MKSIVLIILVCFQSVFAVNLADLKPFDFKVLFTNPVCKQYVYSQVVLANDGSQLYAKPKNVYCKKSDFDNNSDRKSSPHFQLVKLIEDSNLVELSLAFLSFSNSDIFEKLCSAVRNRNLKVSFIMDSKNIGRPSSRELLDKLSNCHPTNLDENEIANIPKTYFRGNKRGLGYAHNKIILAKYKDPSMVKIVFGSANMSSGTILHHENWNFITTSPNSYFYQAHLCVYQGMVEYAESKKEYKSYIKSCRSKIKYEEEQDIKFFIVPSDGHKAMTNIVSNINNSESVDVAVHRIYHPSFRAALTDAAKNGKRVRFIADDDIYWSGKLGRRVGVNDMRESGYVTKLYHAGVNVYYMETNQAAHLLHHNKFAIFNFDNHQGAVHTGAGNFTKAAFSKNFENFYYIKMPKVYKAYKRQYDHMMHDLVSSWDSMPREYVTE